VKVSLVDGDGATVGDGSAPIPTHTPHIGWAEPDPADWGAAACVAATRRVFMSKDLLRFKLTLAWHTDFSDAVGALLAESSTRGWSQELCEMVG
jgi:sugar (pentulose or hexulose) kinase